MAGLTKPVQFSVRQLLPDARLIHADDISLLRCETLPNHCRPGDLYVISPWEDEPDAAAARAMARGVAGVVTERMLPLPVAQCVVPDVTRALVQLYSGLAEHPGKKLLTIGVVGAHGKTSAVVATAAVLRGMGMRVAYYGDLGASDGVAQGLPASDRPTTDGFVEWLSDACDAGCQVAVAELSTAMLQKQQALALHPDVLIVTDGIEATLVREAVSLLPDEGAILANGDCPRLERILETCDRPVLRFGTASDVEVTGLVFKREPGETTVMVTAGDLTMPLRSKLTGGGMVAAQLAAVAAGLLLGGQLPVCLGALERMQRIPGRGQRMPAFSGPIKMLDAADRPQRLQVALKALRGECRGRIQLVMMLPTQADAAMRAALAHVAERLASDVTFTVAEPHRDRFLASAHDALDGVVKTSKPRLVANWKRAVREAVERAGNSDAVLVVCPRDGATAEQHRELLQEVTRMLEDQRDVRPATLPHPALLTA